MKRRDRIRCNETEVRSRELDKGHSRTSLPAGELLLNELRDMLLNCLSEGHRVVIGAEVTKP